MTEFAGAVLCGGSSRRMGTDKALLEIDGTPMACAVADALRRAGAASVVAVGGPLAALAALGLDGIDDEHPGEGPLGGVLTALRWSPASVMLVAPCDLVAPDSRLFTTLVARLDGAPRAMAAIPYADGARRPLPGAFRSSALGALTAAFVSGERAVHRAMAELDVVDIDGLDARALADADSPGDLPPVR